LLLEKEKPSKIRKLPARVNKKRVLIFSIIVFATFVFRCIFSLYVDHFIPRYGFPTGIENPVIMAPDYHTGKPFGASLTELLLRWDSGFYAAIARHGYARRIFSTEVYENWAFFPLYPLIVKFITNIYGNTLSLEQTFLTGLVLSNVFLIFSLELLWLLFKELKFKEREITISLIILLTFPAAYFLNLFYTESLFLLLTAAFFLFLFKNKFFYASLALSLALITRVNALVLLFIAVYYVLAKRRDLSTRRLIYAILLIGASLIPLVIHNLHLMNITGDFFTAYKIQKAWNSGVPYPFAYIKIYLKDAKHFVNPGQIINLAALAGAFLTTFLFMVQYNAKNRNKQNSNSLEINSLFLYTFLSLCLMISVPSGSSILRYILVVFPLYIFFAFLIRDRARAVILTFFLYICISLQTLFFTFYLINGPVYSY
jgi:Gpi18-like mannosyltransferase